MTIKERCDEACKNYIAGQIDYEELMHEIGMLNFGHSMDKMYETNESIAQQEHDLTKGD